MMIAWSFGHVPPAMSWLGAFTQTRTRELSLLLIDTFLAATDNPKGGLQLRDVIMETGTHRSHAVE